MSDIRLLSDEEPMDNDELLPLNCPWWAHEARILDLRARLLDEYMGRFIGQSEVPEDDLQRQMYYQIAVDWLFELHDRMDHIKRIDPTWDSWQFVKVTITNKDSLMDLLKRSLYKKDQVEEIRRKIEATRNN